MTPKPKGRRPGSRSKGYSVFADKRSRLWVVQYADGQGKRRWIRGIKDRKDATIIGKFKASESDRVRAGAVSADESHLKQQGELNIVKHVDAWRDAMKHRGCDIHHYTPQRARVMRICAYAEFQCLREVNGDALGRAIARIAGETSPQTAKHYLGAFRSFIKWCIPKRIKDNPTIGVTTKAAGATFQRTIIAPDKLPDLINATIAAGWRANASGKRRALFYAVLAYTGLRKGEARSLTKESFDLSARTVTVEAGYSKHRRRDVIPLPQQFIDLCGDWIRAYKEKAHLFPYGRSWHIERALRKDCADIGIKPSEGERLGVHSFRRQFITQVIRGGGLAVAQDLARHSTPKLTASYADLTLKDYDAALGALPEVRQDVKRKRRRA